MFYFSYACMSIYASYFLEQLYKILSVLYFLLFFHEINFEVTFISLNMAGNYTIYSINREKILTEIFSEYDGKIPPNYDNGKVFKS